MFPDNFSCWLFPNAAQLEDQRGLSPHMAKSSLTLGMKCEAVARMLSPRPFSKNAHLCLNFECLRY